MKTKILRPLLGSAIFVVTLVALLGISKGNAFAATKTWTGGGGNSSFSTSGNWSPSGAPANGDSIVLPADVIFSGCSGSGTTTLNNDLVAANVTLAGLSVNGTMPNGCYKTLAISGNEIKSSGNVTGNSSAPYLSPTVTITATGNITVSHVTSSGGLAIGANNVTVNAVRFSGAVTGSGNLSMIASGGGAGGGDCDYGQATSRYFSGNNSGFSGALTIENVSFNITPSAGDIARHASSVIVNNGYLDFDLENGADMTFATPITLNGTAIVANQLLSDGNCMPNATTRTITISSDVTVTADTEVYLTGRANIAFTGTVTGRDYLKLASGQDGSISFADGSTVKSEMKIVTVADISDCGNAYSASSINTKLIINVDCSAVSPFNDQQYPFETSGILSGSGKVGNVKIMSGGILAPGLSPGTLTTGNVTFVAGSMYEFEIGKDASDQIVAAGTVTLGDGTLMPKIYDGATPAAGTRYVIIDNDGNDAVAGTFKDLPEGATFEAEGYVYQVSYAGGNGNDVTLTIKSVPKVPNTGIARLISNPLLTLSVTTVSALAIVVIAKRRMTLTNK